MPTTKIDGYVRESALNAWLKKEFGDGVVEGEVVWQVTPLGNGESGWTVDAPRYIAEDEKTALRTASLPQRRRTFGPSPVADG